MVNVLYTVLYAIIAFLLFYRSQDSAKEELQYLVSKTMSTVMS